MLCHDDKSSSLCNALKIFWAEEVTAPPPPCLPISISDTAAQRLVEADWNVHVQQEVRLQALVIVTQFLDLFPSLSLSLSLTLHPAV